MKKVFSYKNSTYIQWNFGFIMLFLFLIFILANNDLYQKYIGLVFFCMLIAYYSFLYNKFLHDPHEISINESNLNLKFRNGFQKSISFDDVEYIKKLNNPFFDYVKGRLELKIYNSEKKYRISGNIDGFCELFELFKDAGFKIQ